MNLDFSDEDKMVRDQAARFLAEHCAMPAVRTVLEGERPFAQDVQQGLVDMGLAGTVIPEAYGGVDAGHLTLCLVAQELGRAAAPVPFSSSVYLVADALLLFGSEAQKQKWLPKISAGEVIGALAIVEGVEQTTEANITCNVQNGQLKGQKLVVADGGIADIAIVLTKGPNGTGMYLVEMSADGISRKDIETVDPTRNSVTIDFDNVAAELVGVEGEGWQQLDRLYDRASVLFAFEQIGGAEAALDMAVAYAKERFAFGRAIGSFQGLKHLMADMYTALKLAESNCYYAAWALNSDAPELPLAAATARISATKAYQLCSKDNIQVHGGMGFTWEFDCHIHYRRSNYLALQLGGMKVWEDKLVNALAAAA